MLIIVYLWTGEACWWTIHPASKQRSEGEKVRVGDDLILVSVSSERYLVSHCERYLVLQMEFLCHDVLSMIVHDLIFLYFWIPLFSVTQQNVSALSLWIFLCLPFFSSFFSSICPMGMIAYMWMQHSSRPFGVWPLSAQEARLHKVDVFLTNRHFGSKSNFHKHFNKLYILNPKRNDLSPDDANCVEWQASWRLILLCFWDTTIWCTETLQNLPIGKYFATVTATLSSCDLFNFTFTLICGISSIFQPCPNSTNSLWHISFL